MRRLIVPLVLIAAVFLHGARASEFFLDARYLLDRSSLYVETGLLALAMTLVIVGGEIDLSVASTLALVACVATRLLEKSWPIAAVAPLALVLGAALGAFNGLLVARYKMPSFMVTLATMAAYRGVAQVMVGAESAKAPASLVGIDMATVPGTPLPVPFVLLGLFAVATGLLLHRTTFGRRLYAVGTNERAAFYAGVPTARVKAATFTISGAMAGLAGLVIVSRLGEARYDHGQGMEVDAIAAVVLGGASVSGGSGTVLGTVLALVLVALLRTDMGLANVSAEYQLAAVGALLVFSVLLGKGFKAGRGET